MNGFRDTDSILDQNGFPPVTEKEQGNFFLLAVEIDVLGNQNHFHARGNHFSTIYYQYLLISGDLDQKFQRGECLAYWVFIVEETPERFENHGEESANQGAINRELLNQWLEGPSLMNLDQTSQRELEERKTFRYLHLIPLSFN